MKEHSVTTGSPEETMAEGERLARELRPGDVVALEGGLGAGKTVFVKGLARGLGADPAVPVTSPTFVILHEYPGRVPLYHFDFYRLLREEDAIGVGWDEYSDGDGVCAVEWADKFPGLIGPGAVRVRFAVVDENVRELTFIRADKI